MSILSNPRYTRLFRKYLTDHFAEESLEFWNAAQEYKAIEDYTARYETATAILLNYLSPGGRKELSIDNTAIRLQIAETVPPTSLLACLPACLFTCVTLQPDLRGSLPSDSWRKPALRPCSMQPRRE